MKAEEMSLRAAKILATCPKERIPMIAEIFKASGVVIRDEDIQCFAKTHTERVNTLKENREDIDTSSWMPTTDKCALRLREAFMDGISMTSLANKVGLHRTLLYKYMWGVLKPKPKRAYAIMEAADEMLPHHLSDDEWDVDDF